MFRIRRNGKPVAAKLLGQDGIWHAVPHSCAGNGLTEGKAMQCYETGILRIR